MLDPFLRLGKTRWLLFLFDKMKARRIPLYHEIVMYFISVQVVTSLNPLSWNQFVAQVDISALENSRKIKSRVEKSRDKR